MNREELEKTLSDLHQELGSTGSVDPELRAHLETLVTDIQAVLAGSPAPSGDVETPLGDRSQDAISRFEIEHPRMTMLLGRIADMLSKMGI